MGTGGTVEHANAYHVYVLMHIFIHIKIRYPNNWMVNTKLD